jgi:serine/threonine protein phosphatase PrpC
LSKLYVSDVGAFRGSKIIDDKLYIDEGDDGMLWLPEGNPSVKNFAVITDGIGGIDGEGMKDIERFEKLLAFSRNTRASVREAFFHLCGSEAQSTIASLWLPATFEKRGMILHAGDSHVLRFRDDVVQVLTKEHSVWDSLFDCYGEEIRSIREELEGVYEINDLMKFDDCLRLLHFISVLENVLEVPSEECTWTSSDEFTSLELHVILFELIDDCKRFFYLSLMSDWEEVRGQIGPGTSVDVRPGDRFVLLTDGIYPDVLSLNEIVDVFQETRLSALEAARNLVFASDEKLNSYTQRVKNDDRAAIVLDLTLTPSEHPILAPLKISLGDEIGRYRHRKRCR